MNCYDLHLTGTKPTDDTEWDAVEKMLLGLFKVYIRKDVMMLIKDDTKFGTVKLKWNELKRIYGSSGSMATFNSWAALTSATLDDTKPMFPQLQSLYDARIALEDNGTVLTDLQFSFILIKALPESYASVASTVLASGAPANLTAQTIHDCIIIKEACRIPSGPQLNKIAPVKKKGDKSNVKCFYCQKPGHKRNECQKKKADEEKEKKDKSSGAQASSSNKAVNAHITIPTTAFITEVPDSDNNDFHVSLYASSRSRWLVDSGATHHISPFRSDFATWSPAEGSVSLGGRVVLAQTGVGTVALTPVGCDPNVRLTLHNVMYVPDAAARYF